MGSRTVDHATVGPLVGETARRLLRQDLCAVARAADAASSGRPGPAVVHRLRVCTRRAAAALSVFRPLVPRSQRRWFQRSLRRIRREAGEARDLDVLFARFRAARRRDRTSTTAEAARRRLVEVLARRRTVAGRGVCDLMQPDWHARTAALLAAVKAAGASETVASFSRRRARRAVDRFLSRLDHGLRDGSELHRLRIETKKLRYVLEVLAAGNPTPIDAPGDRPLRRLQSRLGEFTDRAAAADRLRRWSRQEPAPRDRELLAEAGRGEAAAARRARDAYLRWWTTARRDRLARQVRRSLRSFPA